jgi:RimJ/RimL family protein N-acetyltransferase
MKLETARLTMRGFAPEDWPDLLEYLSQPETVKFEPYEPFSPETARREALRRAGDERFLAVCLRGSGKLIGNLYFAKRDFEAYELGYVFNAQYGRQGYATEAASALMGDLFAKKGAHRLFAECNPQNERSCRLLERLGFRREGHLRQNIFFKRGEDGVPLWQDTLLYGLLSSEWEKPRM